MKNLKCINSSCIHHREDDSSLYYECGISNVIEEEEDKSFAQACNGLVGWFNGDDVRCCGNCKA